MVHWDRAWTTVDHRSRWDKGSIPGRVISKTYETVTLNKGLGDSSPSKASSTVSKARREQERALLITSLVHHNRLRATEVSKSMEGLSSWSVPGLDSAWAKKQVWHHHDQTLSSFGSKCTAVSTRDIVGTFRRTRGSVPPLPTLVTPLLSSGGAAITCSSVDIAGVVQPEAGKTGQAHPLLVQAFRLRPREHAYHVVHLVVMRVFCRSCWKKSDKSTSDVTWLSVFTAADFPRIKVCLFSKKASFARWKRRLRPA